MSSANNPILYRQLETNEIRLLLLLPGSGDEVIYCELATVKLKKEGKKKVSDYHALSYLWGKPQPSSQIYISGAPFEVRSNLFEALKQLRYTYFPRCLWVDAICINQADNSERGAQVSIMSDIFRAAAKVLVWLGKEGDNNHMAFELLVTVNGDLCLFHDMSSSWSAAHVAGTKSRSNQVESALLSICRRPYWTRLWIIQKILSASTIDVLCGARALDWEIFWKVFQTMHCIVHMNTTWRLSEIKSTPAYQIAKKASTQRESYTIEELITLCSICNSQCEDIRDRIYGLLSLCKDLKIVPDYSKSTLALYLDVIQAHYRSHMYPKNVSYGRGWWREFNCGCSTFQTTRTLLGNPFWDPVNERFTMNHSLLQYCLSQEFKETFIKVRVCAIARICEVSAILLATAPWNESAPSSLYKKISPYSPSGFQI